MQKPIEIHICRDEEEAWDTIWRWSWFTREIWVDEYWEKTRNALQPLLPLLSELGVRSILDCSCGLGFKTIMLAKMGYNVEGSDMSSTAIKHAVELAREHGLKIRFFCSRFDELGKHCKRKYDCVYSDYFDELGEYNALQESAKGIYSVLREGGKFIFSSVPPGWTRRDLERLIWQLWSERQRFSVDPPVEKSGLRVTHIEVADKTSEGILENHIYLVEEGSSVRAEIAPIMNPRVKWLFRDYVKVLKDAGFRSVEAVKKGEEEVFVVSTK